MKNFIWASYILNIFVLHASQMSEPYNSINVLPQNMDGWFTKENSESLRQLITEHQPKVIVELGSWLGLSTIFMAKLLDDNGKLYAIDNWVGEDIIAYSNKSEIAGVKHIISVLFQQFLSNVIHHNMSNKIIPIRMDTKEAAVALNVKADLIYVDASHDEESVFNDIMSWYPKLTQRGVMCGDDWKWESVRRGVDRAAGILNIDVISNGNFWRFVVRA
jgi:predicted O-methyltransferase YrrM